MESDPPTSAPTGEPFSIELSEEEKVRRIEEQYRTEGRYIDGTPAHTAALHFIEERGIKKFTHRQHLFKVLYHLTDPPPKEPKARPQTPPPPPSPEPPPRNLVSLPMVDLPHDTGGEGGM